MFSMAEYSPAGTGWIYRTVDMEFGASTMPIKLPLRSQVSIFRHGLMESHTSSRSDHLPGEVRSWQEGREQRLTRIRAVKGKYASALTDSEAFARRKREEIELER